MDDRPKGLSRDARPKASESDDRRLGGSSASASGRNQDVVVSGSGGGGGGGRRGGGAGQGDLFREEGAEAAAFGLSASGAEVEQAEMNEGMGDDLDFEEDFQDDEADEEKNQFEGMDFHDDAMSDDEGDEGKDDKDDKAQKEQAELDKTKAHVDRNAPVETKRWREAEHEEAKARPEKRAKETKGRATPPRRPAALRRA